MHRRTLHPELDAGMMVRGAIADYKPVRIFALFSGGHDSSVLVDWASSALAGKLDAAVFIDTGTALPGVADFIQGFCAKREIPLRVYSAPACEYSRMVRAHGFPGPAAHRFAYTRLKERQVDALVRDHKTAVRDRVMLLTGVRRSESARRMGSVEPVTRDGAQVWVAPLTSWTREDVRAYRQTYCVEESDVAALLHRSGECNCGAFAAAGERDELRALYPTWWSQQIAPLERSTNQRWGERPQKARRPTAGVLCTDCGAR
jgi:3'-phosphoadenosine 5'-phosphosulfate sulfotransferase (PAPS reductase)/FAD synthetase